MWRYACALALLCAALTRCSSFKRAEMSTVPFVLGSRYGRSAPRMIVPRNDRFYMGTRYGKRSETPLHVALRSLQSFPDTAWKDHLSICDLSAFAPLCSRAATKSLYNRLNQRLGDEISDQD